MKRKRSEHNRIDSRLQEIRTVDACNVIANKLLTGAHRKKIFMERTTKTYKRYSTL